MRGSGVLWTVGPVAHPVSAHPHVEVPLLGAVGVSAFLVLVVAMAVPARRARPTAPNELDAGRTATTSWAGRLTASQKLGRAASVAALLTAVVAGRFGSHDELENLAPALTVGAGWPLLIVASLLVGPVWRWVDPFDALGRLLLRGDASLPQRHVWPAVVLALPLLWFLSVHPRPLDPRAVGTALFVYTVVTFAGCLALGRVRWLSSAEPVGILLTWMALTPRRRLAAWQPPAGAGALVGVTLGGLLFGALRRTGLWGGVAVLPGATLYSTLALIAACAAGAGLVALASRVAYRAGTAGAVVGSLLPGVAAVALAVALDRNRLFTSVQLLPGLIGDPFGRGWDLFGSSTADLDPAPLGAAGLVALQLVVVVLGHMLGAAVTARRSERVARLPAVLVLMTSTVASVITVSLH